MQLDIEVENGSHTQNNLYTIHANERKGKQQFSSKPCYYTRGNELRNERVVHNFLEHVLQLNSHNDSSNHFLMPDLDESDKTLYMLCRTWAAS